MTNYIQVPVPEQHVPRVYALLTQLDAESGSVPPVVEESATSELDEKLVRRMYRDSHSMHRELMEFLAAHPGDWFKTSQLVEEFGLDSRRSMSGVFGAFGKRANHRYGGAKPWQIEWEPGDAEVSYWMTDEVAGWIKSESEVSR